MNPPSAEVLTKSRSPHCGGCCTRLVDFGVTLNQTIILEQINLHVHCGELTAIIGPNGAGKTTLFRAMLGEVPHAGKLRFVHAGDGARFVAPRIGYVPQKLDLDTACPVSVMDLFAGATTLMPVWLGCTRAKRRETLARLAVVEAENLIDRKLGQLSFGQLQRVLLALALHPLPDLLLLDEPVSGMDQAGTSLFYRMVSDLRRAYDLSILIISHDLAEVARFADRLVFLNRTILSDGPPADVLASPVVRQAFNLDLNVPDVVAPVTETRHHPPAGAAAGTGATGRGSA